MDPIESGSTDPLPDPQIHCRTESGSEALPASWLPPAGGGGRWSRARTTDPAASQYSGLAVPDIDVLVVVYHVTIVAFEHGLVK